MLYKTTMPSVLIETGFLTNAEAEKFLADEVHQEEMASCIYRAFEEYKAEIEGVELKPSKERKTHGRSMYGSRAGQDQGASSTEDKEDKAA